MIHTYSIRGSMIFIMCMCEVSFKILWDLCIETSPWMMPFLIPHYRNTISEISLKSSSQKVCCKNIIELISWHVLTCFIKWVSYSIGHNNFPWNKTLSLDKTVTISLLEIFLKYPRHNVCSASFKLQTRNGHGSNRKWMWGSGKGHIYWPQWIID